MVFIGVFIDLINGAGILRTPESIVLRIIMLFSAILIIGIATYFYLRVELGAGPRDGLMEGLIIKLKKPVWLIRGGIEVSVLTLGFIMGGPVGIGTLLFAFAIGPSIQLAFNIGKYRSMESQHINFIELYKQIRVRESVEQE